MTEDISFSWTVYSISVMIVAIVSAIVAVLYLHSETKVEGGCNAGCNAKLWIKFMLDAVILGGVIS